MVLGGGVVVCLLLSAHRVVIFAIARLSCFHLVITTSTCRHSLLVTEVKTAIFKVAQYELLIL